MNVARMHERMCNCDEIADTHFFSCITDCSRRYTFLQHEEILWDMISRLSSLEQVTRLENMHVNELWVQT